jgi:hypothetical protein
MLLLTLVPTGYGIVYFRPNYMESGTFMEAPAKFQDWYTNFNWQK